MSNDEIGNVAFDALRKAYESLKEEVKKIKDEKGDCNNCLKDANYIQSIQFGRMMKKKYRDMKRKSAKRLQCASDVINGMRSQIKRMEKEIDSKTWLIGEILSANHENKEKNELLLKSENGKLAERLFRRENQ